MPVVPGGGGGGFLTCGSSRVCLGVVFPSAGGEWATEAGRTKMSEPSQHGKLQTGEVIVAGGEIRKKKTPGGLD